MSVTPPCRAHKRPGIKSRLGYSFSLYLTAFLYLSFFWGCSERARGRGVRLSRCQTNRLPERSARGASYRWLRSWRAVLLSLYSTYSRGAQVSPAAPKLLMGFLLVNRAAVPDAASPVPMTGGGNTMAKLRRIRETVEGG